MEAPLIVVDDDIDVFETVEETAKYVEAPDVRRGLKIYDRNARPVRALIRRRWLGAEIVQLEPDNGPPQTETVRGALVRLLMANESRDAAAYRDLSLDELWRRALLYKTQ